MDMKKILQAIDSAGSKPVAGANDMKKFMSIVSRENKKLNESVIAGFEEGSIGGDANQFLLAADKIQDEVMRQVQKIKINADEANLRDMMEKFNAFMTAYHNVGKEILQPDLFNDSMGEGKKSPPFDGPYKKPGEKKDEFGNPVKHVAKHLAKKGMQSAEKKEPKKESLSFRDYAALAEAKKQMQGKDPCWTGYEMVGTKKKGSKEVPNCVPKK
jgi:hypothetical protein